MQEYSQRRKNVKTFGDFYRWRNRCSSKIFSRIFMQKPQLDAPNRNFFRQYRRKFHHRLCFVKTDFSPTVKLFLTVGFCGGLTTFSTFSAECLDYLASGKVTEFLLYTLLSVTVCVVAAGLGVYSAKLL